MSGPRAPDPETGSTSLLLRFDKNVDVSGGLDDAGDVLDLVLLLEVGTAQTPQEQDEPHPPVAQELLCTILSIVNVQGVDLVGDVHEDGAHGGVVGPGLLAQPARVQQAKPHGRGEAG